MGMYYRKSSRRMNYISCFILLYSMLFIMRTSKSSSLSLSSRETKQKERRTQAMKDCYLSAHYPLYDNMIYLKGKGNDENSDLTFHYKLSEADNTFSALMEYRGRGYVSWGVSSNGMMVPGEAVIGLPDEVNSQINP